MDNEAVPAARIEVLWRPGCPFCSRLRRGLARAGIETVEHDIWADPEAAARVREVTGGDETIPTVLVGSRALVNPSVAGVVAAVRAEFRTMPRHLSAPLRLQAPEDCPLARSGRSAWPSSGAYCRCGNPPPPGIWPPC